MTKTIAASVLVGCGDGRPCEEVTARLVAADKAQHVVGDGDAGRRLRETAARWADLHQQGSPRPDELRG